MQWRNTGNMIIRGGRVIDPAAGRDLICDVLVLNGLITDVSPRLTLSPERENELDVVDGTGLWVIPGMIDMHVHLREPGEEYKETIASGTMAAVAGGFTGVACMPNTRPVNDCASVTKFILERAREQGACRVYPVGAISRGSMGENLSEFGELREAGAVAVTDDGRPVMSSLLMRRAMEYARAFDLPVISHSEDHDLSSGGLMNEGAVSTMLGLTGAPAAAEEVMIARDIILSGLTGGRLHVAHVSSAGSVRLIREAKSRGIPVTAETAPHYFTLTDRELMGFDTVYKVNPPLRGPEDIEAIKGGLADGTIDVIATDHAPHSILEKDTEFEYAANGMIGLESALPLILELVHSGVLSPSEAVARVTVNPAKVLNIPAGTLLPGGSADICLINPDEEYVIDASNFQSKGRNCPFNGREVRGRASLTIFQGRVAHSSAKPA